MKRFLPAPLLLALVGACSSTPTVIPTRNLESPTDMTFVCLKTDGDVLSGQPMSVCHEHDTIDPATSTNGQRVLGTFAFITNPGRNEIAIADMDTGRLLDLSPQAPGYGMLPVGNDPEVVASSQDGCWVVTANRISCDYTMMDPARLLSRTFSSASTVATPSTGAGRVAQRIVVQTKNGLTLAASTGELAFLPPASAPATCDAAATSRAVATFPGCSMVALLDFSFASGTATIADAYYVRPSGVVAAGGNPVCPAECEMGAVDAGAPPEAGIAEPGVDGGSPAVDGGATPAAGDQAYSYLQALALEPNGRRIYVGGLGDDSVTSFDIAPTGFANPSRVTLAENPGGVLRLRLNVDPYALTPRDDGMTGAFAGKFVDGRGRFLYAFTGDDSVRVINLDGTPVECDVNLIIDSADVPDTIQSCHPVGEGKFPRRPLLRGPGLQVPRFSNPDSPAPVPRDISFADLKPQDGDTNYHALSGQFGFLLASSGQVYVVNVAPLNEAGGGMAGDGTPLPATATHSIRELRYTGKAARMPLAFLVVPQRTITASDQAFPTTVSYSAVEGPLIQSYSTDNGVTTSWIDFPDPNYLVSRLWNVTWEGPLPEATRASGIVGSNGGDLAGALDDSGADYCASGVQPGDIVMFSGCTQNADCQPDNQFICQPVVSGGAGMCLPIDSTTRNNLISNPTCARILGSRMRYEVARATATHLDLKLKLDEVPKTSLNPCQTNEDCKDIDHKAFECLDVSPGDRRCVNRCVHDSDCRAGHVCDLPEGAASGLCVEAPPLDKSCFPQPMTAYSVRAGRAFMVYGNSMPSLSPLRRTPSGTCEARPAADPSLVARIPLSAPRCPDELLQPARSDTGARWVQELPAQAGSNPCLYQSDAYRDRLANATSRPGAVRALFQNPQIRFVLSNVDQYPGDLLTIHFELQYGFELFTAATPYEVLLTMGARIITGPTQTPESPIRRGAGSITYPYMYVVDQGRTALAAGSHGQVVRVNPRSSSSEIFTFDTALSGSTPFQIQ